MEAGQRPEPVSAANAAEKQRLSQRKAGDAAWVVSRYVLECEKWSFRWSGDSKVAGHVHLIGVGWLFLRVGDMLAGCGFLQAEYLQVVALLVRDAVNQASEQQNEPTGQGVMHTVGQVLRILKDRQVAFGQKNRCWSKRSSSFYLYSICLDYSSVQIRLLVSGDTAECSIYLLIFGIFAGKCCKIKENLHGCNFCSVKL